MAAGCPRKHWGTVGSILTVAQVAACYEEMVAAKVETKAVRDRVRLALTPLRELYGPTPAAEFGPRKLKAVRSVWIRGQLSRAVVNERVQRVRRMFKWAVAEELIPPMVAHGLDAVAGLRHGEEGVREGRRVLPVIWEHVEPVLNEVSREVAAIIQLQWWTGARSGEIVAMRPVDIDRSSAVWLLRPQRHKTQRHCRSREISLGPRAQEALRPFLDRVPSPDPLKPVFSPERAEQERVLLLSAARKTRVQPSQVDRKLERERRRLEKLRSRAPREAYDSNTYARAVKRGIDAVNALAASKAIMAAVIPLVEPRMVKRVSRFVDRLPANATEHRVAHAFARALRKKADASQELITAHEALVARAIEGMKDAPTIPSWHPHRLRHAAATRLRKEHGLEAARVVLGHAGAAVTELYAEIDHEKARRIAQMSG
jgi:integrase